jgi:transcriptional regulator with XRE-family HTH domain
MEGERMPGGALSGTETGNFLTCGNGNAFRGRIYMSVGEKLRHLRLTSKKTLKEQSELFGVSLNTVFRWEHDLTTPRKSVLQKISVYYGVPMEWLLQEDISHENMGSGSDAQPEDDNEWQLLKMYRKLSITDKYKVLGYIERVYIEEHS